MKKKVLLVDDKKEFLRLVKSFLHEKYEVETADNVGMALGRLQSGFKPDVIVSDLMMPDADGRSLVSLLKESEIYNNIPVIILSSMDKSSHKIELLKLGAKDYLTKPFNPEELEIRIQNLL